MNISYAGLRSLSWPFIGAFVLVWNILMLLAIWMNGGPGPFRERSATLIAGATCLLASLISFAIVFSESWRRLVTAEKRIHYYQPGVFVFIGILTAFLALQALLWQP